MNALNAQEKQIVDLFRKLPIDRRSQVILALAKTDADGWAKHQAHGESKLRQLAADRGLNWDSLSDDERQDFVESFPDEARP